MSQLVNLRIDESLLSEVDSEVETGLYASRAEFIRDALRRLLFELRKQQSLRMLRKNFGKEENVPEFDKSFRKEIFKEYLENKS